MTIAERINAERVVLAGWSRAILLQLAHPLVAQGVADHSSFSRHRERRTPTPTPRPRRTPSAGTPNGKAPPAQAAARCSRRRAPAPHRAGDAASDLRRPAGRGRRSTGFWRSIAASMARWSTASDPTGRHPYSAEDPSLVLWVPATLLDSLPRVYEAVVRPISDDERDAWCRESAPVARALGGGDDVPETWAERAGLHVRDAGEWPDRGERHRPRPCGRRARAALFGARSPHGAP